MFFVFCRIQPHAKPTDINTVYNPTNLFCCIILQEISKETLSLHTADRTIKRKAFLVCEAVTVSFAAVARQPQPREGSTCEHPVQ